MAAGVDVNARDNRGNTPLHWAVSDGHDIAAKILIEAGADVNVKSKDGSTPLYGAAAKGTGMWQKYS